MLGERIAKSISLYETEPVKPQQARTIVHEPADYIDTSKKLQRPDPIDKQLQYNGMKITNVQSTKGLGIVEGESQTGSYNLLQGRSKSIDKASANSSMARKRGLEGAIQDALAQRKRSTHGNDVISSKRIPMRTAQIRKAGAAK